MHTIGRLLFYTLIVLLPLQFGRHFWPEQSFVHGVRIDYLSPTIYATDILIFILAGICVSSIKRHAQRLIRTISIVLVIVGAHIVLTSSWEHILPGILKTIMLIEGMVIVHYIQVEKPNIITTGKCLLIASIWSSVLAWLQFVGQQSVGDIWWFLGERTFSVSTPGIALATTGTHLILRPYATFPHPNVLAGFLVISLPLTYLYFRSKKMPAWSTYGSTIGIISTIVISLSRSAWIAGICIAAGICIDIFLTKGTRHIASRIYQYKKALVAGIVLLALCIPVVVQRFSTLFTLDSTSVSHRLLLTSAARAMIREHPVTGIGLNQFIPNIPKYMPITSAGDFQPVHSIFLLIGAETGVIGLGIFLFFSGRLIMNIWKARRVSPKVMPLTWSLLGILIISLFDHYFFTIRQTLLLTGVIIGFAMNNSAKSGRLDV